VFRRTLSLLIIHTVNLYVLLTVHLGIIFVNNQLDAQLLFMYFYFYSLHVSGSHVPIIRRINCINTTSGICHRTKRSFIQSDIYQMSGQAVEQLVEALSYKSEGRGFDSR
jgi:hypothetical protein